jgi:hypothetical protein
MGGTLLVSRLRVFDLVGLCDRDAARTLRSDTPAFHRYVLEEVRPTFIHVHGPWSGWAAFHSNPLFAEAYVPIRESWGAAQAPEPASGDYVRRDALGPDPQATLRRLQRAYVAAGMDRPSF